VVVTSDLTLSASITTGACSTPPNAVTIIKQAGVKITPAGHGIFNMVPLGLGEERYSTNSDMVGCGGPGCPNTRPIDHPTVFFGRSDSFPGTFQYDSTVIVQRSTTDSVGGHTCVTTITGPGCDMSRMTLTVQTDYGNGTNTTGTAGGILSNFKLHGVVDGKGSTAISGYVSDDVATATGVAAVFGACQIIGTEECDTFAAEYQTLAATPATLAGLRLNEQASVGNLHAKYGIWNGTQYPAPVAIVTDLVANGTTTVTSATGFSGAAEYMAVAIPRRGIYEIETVVDPHTLVLWPIPGGNVPYGAPASGTGLTAYVGVNPGYSMIQENTSGHNIGNLLVRDGNGSVNDFFTTAFATQGSQRNIMQLINAPEVWSGSAWTFPTGTGYTNNLQFWRGWSQQAAGQGSPIVQGLNGYETAKLRSDITSGGGAGYQQGFLDIYTDQSAALVQTARFDAYGLTVYGPGLFSSTYSAPALTANTNGGQNYGIGAEIAQTAIGNDGPRLGFTRAPCRTAVRHGLSASRAGRGIRHSASTGTARPRAMGRSNLASLPAAQFSWDQRETSRSPAIT
jgi:hypothetical protein